MDDTGQPATDLISVCICTFKRPAGLQAALESVLKQKVLPGANFEIVVVDNDPLASANEQVYAIQCANPDSRLIYVNETTPGVSFARNRCLREASGNWIAFLDDDEAASTNWLSDLLETATEYKSDAVFGPVISKFQDAPPRWMTAKSIQERKRFPTGVSIGWQDARTGNVLFKKKLLNQIPPFDVAFAASGGEDSLFFARAVASGARLTWCDEGYVEEDVANARLTLPWLLRRAFVGGQNFVRIQAELKGYAQYPRYFFRGCGGIFVHLFLGLVYLSFSRANAFQHMRKLVGDFGKVLALFSGHVVAHGVDSEK